VGLQETLAQQTRRIDNSALHACCYTFIGAITSHTGTCRYLCGP
jgi:hypothetical protein